MVEFNIPSDTREISLIYNDRKLLPMARQTDTVCCALTVADGNGHGGGWASDNRKGNLWAHLTRL